LTAAGPTRDDYRHFMAIQTRWSDNDVYGHVNNVVYYAYFDTVINRYLIEHGGLDPHEGDLIGLCVESRCTYVAPAAYPDDLEAGMKTIHLGRSSVRYGLAIFRGLELLAHGEFVHVFVTRNARVPAPMPEKVRRALEALG
jgi:acyl-CoA thioester hydrolase